jgi:RimJ/RimL family protein N-acetyltransferase
MEIGWRLARAAWGRGLATAAAREVLRRAFVNLKLPQVVSFTATSNLRSQAVMRRIGMQLCGRFEHPRVPDGHAVRPHVLYAIDREAWLGLPTNRPA